MTHPSTAADVGRDTATNAGDAGRDTAHRTGADVRGDTTHRGETGAGVGTDRPEATTADIPRGARDGAPGTDDERLTVLVYSHDAKVREKVRVAVGARPARDLPRFDYVEAETGEQVVARCDRGGIDLAILDGEAWPTGGMGLGRQLKDELVQPPPVLVLTGRRDDAWLATWSRADAAVPHPLDAVRLTDAVTGLLRRFRAARG